MKKLLVCVKTFDLKSMCVTHLKMEAMNAKDWLNMSKLPLVSKNGRESHRSVFLLSSVCAQFSSAPRACVSGHGTGGKGAIYLRVGLLHRPDRVHPERHAHTWHCLSRLRPRRTGKQWPRGFSLMWVLIQRGKSHYIGNFFLKFRFHIETPIHAIRKYTVTAHSSYRRDISGKRLSG